MIMDLVASKFIASGAKRARNLKEMKTVVFREPVGNDIDTPMREVPE